MRRLLLALILALPDEPSVSELTKAGTENAKAMVRARYIRRKVDLLGDCTRGFTSMLSAACDAALIVAPMRNKDDPNETGRLDFSKLTALQINIGAAVESAQQATKQAVPIETGPENVVSLPVGTLKLPPSK